MSRARSERPRTSRRSRRTARGRSARGRRLAAARALGCSAVAELAGAAVQQARVRSRGKPWPCRVVVVVSADEPTSPRPARASLEHSCSSSNSSASYLHPAQPRCALLSLAPPRRAAPPPPPLADPQPSLLVHARRADLRRAQQSNRPAAVAPAAMLHYNLKALIKAIRSTKTIADERALIVKESAAIRTSFKEEGQSSFPCSCNPGRRPCCPGEPVSTTRPRAGGVCGRRAALVPAGGSLQRAQALCAHAEIHHS